MENSPLDIYNDFFSKNVYDEEELLKLIRKNYIFGDNVQNFMEFSCEIGFLEAGLELLNKNLEVGKFYINILIKQAIDKKNNTLLLKIINTDSFSFEKFVEYIGDIDNPKSVYLERIILKYKLERLHQQCQELQDIIDYSPPCEKCGFIGGKKFHEHMEKLKEEKLIG